MSWHTKKPNISDQAQRTGEVGVDAANPCVFVHASVFGCQGSEIPTDIDAHQELVRKLDAIRAAASVAMGIAPSIEAASTVASIPKVALISPPTRFNTLSGRALGPDNMDINVRMLSMGQAHRAVPLTGAMCLAVACRLPGSLPHQLTAPTSGPIVRIAHPSGVIPVEAMLTTSDSSVETLRVDYVAVERTARRLFEGFVRCPDR